MSDEPKSPEDFPPEVGVAFAAKYLGTTERTILNYLKSRQLEGQKVGKPWFIKTTSLFKMRPPGTTLRQAVLPPIENPKNLNQEKRESRKNVRTKNWDLIKGPKRNPLRLNAFARLKESADLVTSIEELVPGERDFFETAVQEVGDDLGAGYYSFGPIKKKLYSRARLRSGRLVSRSILLNTPAGLVMSFCQLAEAVSYLCRSLDRRSPPTKQPTSESSIKKGASDVPA